MSRRQPRPARRACAVATLCGLAAACLPAQARAEVAGDVVRWLDVAAVPTLQIAAPTNDPSLASRELLNRGLAGAFSQVPQVAPAPLARLNLGLSFDPALQPRYAIWLRLSRC